MEGYIEKKSPDREPISEQKIYLDSADTVKNAIITSLHSEKTFKKLINTVVSVYDNPELQSKFGLSDIRVFTDNFDAKQILSLRLVQVFCSSVVTMAPVDIVFSYVQNNLKEQSVDEIKKELKDKFGKAGVEIYDGVNLIHNNKDYIRFLKNIDNISKIIPNYKTDSLSKNLLFLAWLEINKNTFKKSYQEVNSNDTKLKNGSQITEFAKSEGGFDLFLKLVELNQNQLTRLLSNLSVENWIAVINRLEKVYGLGVLGEQFSRLPFSSRLFHTSFTSTNLDSDQGKIPTIYVNSSTITQNLSMEQDHTFFDDDLEFPKTNSEFLDYINRLEQSLLHRQQNPQEYTQTTDPETVLKTLKATIEHHKTVWNLYNYCINKRSDLKDLISLTASSLYLNSEGNERVVRFDLVIENEGRVVLVEVKSNPLDWGNAVAQIGRYGAIMRRNGYSKDNQQFVVRVDSILPVIVLSKSPEDDEYTEEAIEQSGFNIIMFDTQAHKLDNLLDLTF
jgi:hypothetical protein